jgi:hypothetical protein
MADKFLQKNAIPSAATETTLYTVPAATTAILKSLRVTNANASSSNITVIQNDSGSTTDHFLFKDQALAADASVDVFAGVPVVLESGDKLNVQSSQATVHFYLSYLEVDRN